MATRTEASTVYAAGLVQGIVPVTFPAASTIFTDPAQYDLSSTQYGTMFLPQVVTAITASLLGGTLARRLGTKRVYLVGLLANMVSMALLIVSQFVAGDPDRIRAAPSGHGVPGGGLRPGRARAESPDRGVPPGGVDTSVLTLNALLGLGTALAPAFVAIFVGLGFWWGLPVLSAVLLMGLLVVSLRLPLRSGAREADKRAGAAGAGIPARFWLFAAFAVLYGICETMNGNWAQLDMTRLGASATLASLALTTFWAMVTVGRVLFALVQRWFPTRRTYHLLPFVLAGAFVLIAVLPQGTPALGVLAFGLAGLGCSALLPLTISFGQEQLVVMSASVAGGVIAFYQLGYGIAAFGAGPLQDAGVALPSIFGATAVAAAVMGVLSFALAGRRGAPEAQRPQQVTE